MGLVELRCGNELETSDSRPEQYPRLSIFRKVGESSVGWIKSNGCPNFVPSGWKSSGRMENSIITSLKSSFVGNSSKRVENIQGWKAYQARIREVILGAGFFRANGYSKGLEIFPNEDKRDNASQGQ